MTDAAVSGRESSWLFPKTDARFCGRLKSDARFCGMAALVIS